VTIPLALAAVHPERAEQGPEATAQRRGADARRTSAARLQRAAATRRLEV